LYSEFMFFVSSWGPGTFTYPPRLVTRSQNEARTICTITVRQRKLNRFEVFWNLRKALMERWAIKGRLLYKQVGH
jgi:hypothetical protein